MNRINYSMKEHGFVGHLSIPEQSTKYGVIVIMGGEQSLLTEEISETQDIAMVLTRLRFRTAVDSSLNMNPKSTLFVKQSL